MVVGVGEEVVVPDDVTLPVGDIEAVAIALIVDDDVIVEVTVPLNDIEDVPLADPPTLKVLVGVAVTVLERLILVDPLSLPLCVCDGDVLDVLMLLPVVEPVPLDDALIVDVVESIPLSLDVKDGPAPFVGDVVIVPLAESENKKMLVVIDAVGEVIDSCEIEPLAVEITVDDTLKHSDCVIEGIVFTVPLAVPPRAIVVAVGVNVPVPV